MTQLFGAMSLRFVNAAFLVSLGCFVPSLSVVTLKMMNDIKPMTKKKSKFIRQINSTPPPAPSTHEESFRGFFVEAVQFLPGAETTRAQAFEAC